MCTTDNKKDSDFSRTFFPTETTLFRYSQVLIFFYDSKNKMFHRALTYNAHKIHINPTYTKEVEGFSDCLVHGPLTSTLLISLAQQNLPEKSLKAFSYRALKPLFVNKPIQLNLKKTSNTTAETWAVDKQQLTLAMKGTFTFVH